MRTDFLMSIDVAMNTLTFTRHYVCMILFVLYLSALTSICIQTGRFGEHENGEDPGFNDLAIVRSHID